MQRSTQLGALVLALGLLIQPATRAQQVTSVGETPTIDQLIAR